MPALARANIPIRTMSKAQTDDLPYRPDPKRIHEEIDRNVKLPRQVGHAAATAEALSAGTAVPPPRPSKARSRGFQHTDAEIDQVLQDWDRGALKPDDPNFEMIIDLAREGARHIKARRRGAQRPRKASGKIIQRINALLEAYIGLSPKLQATPTGARTVAALRKSVIKKLGLRDNDDAISEDTIIKDVPQLGGLFKLVREGVIPRSGKLARQPNISDKTRQEMKAGAKAVARGEALARTADAEKPRGKLTRQSNISDKTRQEMKAGAKTVARAARAKKPRGGPGRGQKR